MELAQKLQLSPFQGRKEGYKYLKIRLTDITLHTAQKQYPLSQGKKFVETISSDKPGRMFFPIQMSDSTGKDVGIFDTLNNDPEFIKYVHDKEKEGYKVLLEIPDGLPVLIGKDTHEFIHSKNGKRILRKIMKEKP